MSLVRWTGPILEDIPPWVASERVAKENPKITEETEKALYADYLKQFERPEPHAVYLKAGSIVYRGGETQPYDAEFRGAATYQGAFFGDLSVAAGYYRMPGSAQMGASPRSVAEMTLLRPLRLFPMNYTNLRLLAKDLWNPKTDVTNDERVLMLEIIEEVQDMGVKGGLNLNVKFGILISTLETPTLGKYDGFAFYRAFFEPADTPEGQKTRRAFSESSNEQCYIKDVEGTFLKEPYVYSDPTAGVEGFPNFWGARYPLHPALDKDARQYLASETWKEPPPIQDLPEWDYYNQFRYPDETFYADFFDPEVDVQAFSILPAGSTVYQASNYFPTVFSSREFAERRARRVHPQGVVRKLVTTTPLVLLVLTQRFMDTANPGEKTLSPAKFTEEEMRQFHSAFKMVEQEGVKSSLEMIQLAKFAAKAWGPALGVSGIVNVNMRDFGNVNQYGIDIAKELNTNIPPEVYLAENKGVLDRADKLIYNKLNYLEKNPEPPRRSARQRKNTVLWAPY